MRLFVSLAVLSLLIGCDDKADNDDPTTGTTTGTTTGGTTGTTTGGTTTGGTTGTTSTENQAPSAPEVSISPAEPTSSDDLTCSLDVPSSDPDGDEVSYQYAFTVDGTEVQRGMGPVLDHARTARDQEVSCSASPTDTAGATGDTGTSATVTIGNSAPSIDGLAISPDPASVLDNLVCSWSTFTDADFDSDLSTVSWTMDGAEVGSSPTLTSGFVGGDELTCTVTPFDGTDTGKPVSTSITIGNSTPTVGSVALTPTDASILDTLTCIGVDAQDGDGDPLSMSYSWTIDGKVDATLTANTVELSLLDEGKIYMCSVAVSDGTTDSDWVDSNSVEIGAGPKLEVDTSSVDFGTIDAGCTGESSLVLSNVGSDTALVSSANLLGDGGFAQDLFVPASLAAGDSVTITVSYTTDEATSASGTLVIASDDPRGNQTVALVAESELASSLEAWEYEATPAEVDIIFAFDRSCSMADDITTVLDDFSAFTDQLDAWESDYQVATVVDDDGCINGSDLFIDSSFSAADVETAFTDMVDLWGTYGSYTEQAFMLFTAAMDETGSGGCNEGLVREDASLHLVGFSDEAEQSTGIYKAHVNNLQGYKTNPDDVIFHGIGGDYPSGCASADHYSGMYEASLMTGGSFHSICTSDWSTTLADLADAIIGSEPPTYELGGIPTDDTALTVLVNGTDASGYWSYDDSTNIVTFEVGYLQTGDAVVFQYEGTSSACE